MEQFYIPEKESVGIFKDKGSKFYSYLFPFNTIEELKPILKNLKKSNPKAVHFCFAYRIGIEGKLFRINDDGEPSGSAGKPIFGQLEKFSITDVLIVVVRYFGGTLLGVSGLINAYKNASNEAIKNATLIEKKHYATMQLLFPHEIENQVMLLLKKFEVLKINFITKTELQITIIENQEDHFLLEAKNIWQLELKKIIV